MADNSVVQEGDVVIWDVIGGTQILAEIRGKWYAGGLEYVAKTACRGRSNIPSVL